MSLNVVLTSDKCQFQNYFSDPVILPKNASCALTKCSMVLPIFVQNILKVPQLAIGPERAAVALDVNIDGIYKAITWSDLFTAYSEYKNILQIEPTLSANKFFSGTYEFWTNNYVYIENEPASASDGDKPKFSWVLARALSNTYEFYDITDCSQYDDISIDLGNEPVGDQNITITRPAFGAQPLVTYNNIQLNCNKKLNTKLNIAYNPYRRTGLALTDADISAATDRLNFTWDAGNLRLESTAVVGQSCMAIGNTMDIELNGGYIRTIPSLTGGSMAFGLSLEGIGNGVGDNYQPISNYPTNIIDIGIEFTTEPVSGSTVYRIIDGQVVNNVYDGAAPTIGTFYNSHFKPAQAVCKYTNANDVFAILCRRGNIINGTYEYVFEILMGVDGAALNTYKRIYTAKKTLNNSGIQLAPIFLSSANQGNNRFNGIQFILKGTDTNRQSLASQTTDYSFSNTVKIQPVLDARNQEQINFWSALGLHSYQQTAGGELNQSTMAVSYDGTPLNKTIEWKTNFKDQDNTNTNESYFWIGKRQLSDFYYFDIVTETWRVNAVNALAFLPKMLNVYLLNLTLKNFSGTYNNFQTIGAAIDTTTGEDRIVGTIPIVIEDTTIASDLEIQYETYNPYYRPMNNPDNYPVNEFIVEISYKDFVTDQRKIINDINGILKLELNIKRGADLNVKKIMGVSGVLPLI